VGSRGEAASRDLIVTCTPGEEPILFNSDLRPGQHIAALGADAHGKAEIERKALRRCHLFCDEWEQASGGGEISESVSRGALTQWNVTELGSVLAGTAAGRRSNHEITLFDSTGLAIQDLAIVAAVYEEWKAGGIEAPTFEL
jgi:alanine dehydrogenase